LGDWVIEMLFLLLGIIGLAGQTSGPQPAGAPPLPSIDLPPPLARVLTDYETAWRNRDAAALARLFANDRIVVPNACPPVKGREEVERCYAGSGGPLSLRAVAYGSDGSIGYIVGAYAPEKGQPDGGKFTLTLLKGSDGQWLIVADMDRPYPRK
jgi:ketosteroid isomerase-like protein